MFHNYAFQHQGFPNPGSDSDTASEAASVTVQSLPSEGNPNPIPVNVIMVGCLTPLCIAVLLFSLHSVRRSLRLSRGIRRIQRITTLERALAKTPDECS